MTHPVEGKYVEWPLRAALQDIDDRLRKIEAQVAHPLVTVPVEVGPSYNRQWREEQR